jgi:serine/threonine protein kinase
MRSVESLYLPKVLDSGIETFSTPKGPVVVQYFVMELINGDDLNQELRDNGILSETDWWDLAHDLVRAAATLHEKGIVHADIKPANVMRSARKSVLVDLGGASLVGLSDPGDAGAMTANWAAPEQLRRDLIKPEDWGYEVDVFSIGQTLVQAATGHNPWDFSPPRASGKNLSNRDLLDAWVRHSELMKSSPPRLSGMTDSQQELVASMLRYRPEDRPSSAEILEAIRANLPDNSPRLLDTSPLKPMKWVPQSSLDRANISQPSSQAKVSQQLSWQVTALSFLFGSFIGGLARYLYVDSRESWRNPDERNHYRVVAVSFALFSFGVGFGLIAYRWWGRLFFGRT